MYPIKFFLFSSAVVVGLPKSSLAPMAHLISIKLSSFLTLAALSSLSNCSKVLTLTTFGYPQ